MSTGSVNRSPIRLEENPSETGQCSEDATSTSKTPPRRGRGRPLGSKNKTTTKPNKVVLNINISKEDTSEGDGKAPFLLNLGDIISSLCASGDGVDKKCTINITHNGSKINNSSVIRNNSLNRTPGSNSRKTNKSKRAEESFSPAITSSQKKSGRSSIYEHVYSDSESDQMSLHLTDGEEDCSNNEDAESNSSKDIFEEEGDKSNKTKSVPEKKNAASKSTEKPTRGRYSIRSWLIKSNNATSTPVSSKDNNDLNSTGKKNNENNVLLDERKSGDESDSSTHELANEIIECLNKDKYLNVQNSSVTEKLNGSSSKNSKFRKFTKTRFSLRKSNSGKNVNNKNASSDEEVDSEHEGENGTEKLLNGNLGASLNELSTPRNFNQSEKKINNRSSVRKKVTIADKSTNQEKSNDDLETRSENSAIRYSLRSSVKKQPVVVLKKLEMSNMNKNLRNKKDINTKNDEPSTSGLSHLYRRNLGSKDSMKSKNASCSKENNSGSENDSSDEESWDGDVNSTDNEPSTANYKDSEKRTSNSNRADSIVVEISNNCGPMDASLPENNLNTEKNIDEELLASQNVDTPSKLDILSQETHSNLVLIPVEERENVRLVESVVQRILVSPDKNKSAANVNLQVQNEKNNSERGNSDKNDELQSDTNNQISSEVLVNEKNSATSLNISSNKQSIIGKSKEKNKSSDKLPAVTSSTDYENLNSKQGSQKDKSSDRSVNENNLVSNKNCDNLNKVFPEILMSEFNKKLAMISEITSTQNDDDNKSTNSDKLVIDKTLDSADVVNNPVDESNLQEKVVNENESAIEKDQSEKGKKRKDSCESSSNIRENAESSKMFQKANEMIKDFGEQRKINRSELFKNETSNKIDRQGKAVGKIHAREKGNNSSMENSENSDSEESSDSSSASEIKSNRTKSENLIERGDKYEKNNSCNGLVKHRISIENGCLKQKPDVEERKSQETSGSEADSSSDSEDESARLPTKNSDSPTKKNEADLMKKSEPINESDSDSDSDEERGENSKLVKSRSAEEISRVKENLKKQLLAEEKGSEESSDSDSNLDSSDGEVNKIPTQQKSSSSGKPAGKTKENSNQQLAGGKDESSSESETDSSSDSDSDDEKKNEVEANGKINSLNLEKKDEDTGQREADSSSSEAESDDDSEKNPSLTKKKVSESDTNANSAQSHKENKNVHRNESDSSSSESESDDASENHQTLVREKVSEADKKANSADGNIRRNECSPSSSGSESDSDSENNQTSARKKAIEAQKNYEDTRRDESNSSSSESEIDNDSKKNQTCSKDILSNENARNEKDEAQSKTPSSKSSDDEFVEVKDKEIQIDCSKLEESIIKVLNNSKLVPTIQGNEFPKRKMSIQRSPANSICISREDDSDSIRKKQDNEILSPVRIEETIQIKNSPGQMDFLDARMRRLSKSLESIYSLEKGEVVSRTLGTEVKEDEGTPVKEIPINDSLTLSVGSDSDVQCVREIPKAMGETISKQTENQKKKKSESKEKDKTQKAANTSSVVNPFFEGSGDKSLDAKENSRTKKLPQGAKRKKSGKGANKNGLSSSKKIKVDDEIQVIDLENGYLDLQLEILKKVMLTRSAAAAKAAKDLENNEEVDSAKKNPKKLSKKEEAKGSAKNAKDAEQLDKLDKEKEVKKLLQEATLGLALEDDTEESKKKVKKSPARKIQKEVEGKVKNSTDESVKSDEEEVEKSPKKKDKKSDKKSDEISRKEVIQPSEESSVDSSNDKEKFEEKIEEEIIKSEEKELVKSAEEEIKKSPKKKDKKPDEKTNEIEPVASLNEEAEEKVEEKVSNLSEEEVKKSAEEKFEKSPKKKDKKSDKATRKEVKKPVEEELDSSSNEEKSEEMVEEEIIKSTKKKVKKSAKEEVKKLAENVEKSPKKKTEKLNGKTDIVSREEGIKSVKEDGSKKRFEKDEAEPVEVQNKKKKKAKKPTSIINQSENDIQPLPGHIVSKLEPTKPPVVKKFEKPVKKLKRKANEDSMDDEESPISKKIATGDYIPLEVPGPTKFGVAPLNKFKKALPYSHHAAANFKTQMLYGDRNRRLPSGNLNVIKEKTKFTK